MLLWAFYYSFSMPILKVCFLLLRKPVLYLQHTLCGCSKVPFLCSKITRANHITVFTLLWFLPGESPKTKIGRIHVEDLDDWDLPDKTFFWENNNAHPNFDMDGQTGMITMLNSTGPGTYSLRFLVYDRMHTMDAHANVTVTVKEIPEEAIYNSGSIRVTGKW